MNPYQTAPKEQSDQGPYFLQYKLPKYINRWESRRQFNVNCGKSVERDC